MAVPATRRFPHRSPTALLLPLAVLTLAAVSESARLASPRAALESRDGREAASGGASGAGNAADGPP
ncbi:unnamed protein product, partial [Closterium sp. Naga37s-1]